MFSASKDAADHKPEKTTQLSGRLIDKLKLKASLSELYPDDEAPSVTLISEPNPEHPAYARFYVPSHYKRPDEKEMQTAVQDNASFLKEVVHPLTKLYGPYALILGGESQLGEPSGPHILGSAHLRERFGYEVGGAKKTVSWHTQYFTGRDLAWLGEKFPQERCKFYLSLQLDTEEKSMVAKQFSTELLEECTSKRLSITTKSADHNYDSFNIYTWDQSAMAEVLKRLYVKYLPSGIFKEVPHFFQMHLTGVSEKAVGMVREPMTTADRAALSHSVRMYRLGEYLDTVETAGEDITSESYETACRYAHVCPEAPWEPLPTT